MTQQAESFVDRRTALGAIGLGGAIVVGAATANAEVASTLAATFHTPLTPDQMGWDAAKGEFVLPTLPFAPGALEPHLDAETITIHHTKHHQAYVTALNKALKGLASIRNQQAEPWQIKYYSRELAFNGSGHANHSLFWQVLAPEGKGGGGQPTGALADAISKDFGSFEKFVGHFKEAARQVEGGGWGWLVHHRVSGQLMVMQGEKQQDMIGWMATPILGIDVWEHAYYLKYRSDRAAYINAFMNVINWPRVAELYEAAKGK